MEQLKCVIVDDESNAARLLKLLVEEIDDGIEIAKIFDDPTEALAEIPVMKPDFLLLDVDMPFLSGFQLLEKLQDPSIPVIFVTGFDEYAVKALRMSAVDYLLKPVNIEELRRAINSVRERLAKSDNSLQNRWLLENLKRSDLLSRKLGVPSESSIEFIYMKDIIYLEALDRYTNVVSEHRNPILSSYNVGEFGKLCDDTVFFQTHRSYIINLSKIESYLKEGAIVMSNGKAIPLARRRKDSFLASLQHIIPNR